MNIKFNSRWKFSHSFCVANILNICKCCEYTEVNDCAKWQYIPSLVDISLSLDNVAGAGSIDYITQLSLCTDRIEYKPKTKRTQ